MLQRQCYNQRQLYPHLYRMVTTSISQNWKRNVSNMSNSEGMVRLSKRMSELNLCSRREADQFILDQKVYVRNKLIEPILGQKVVCSESDIKVMNSTGGGFVSANALYDDSYWDILRGQVVMMHKPIGYLSGQPERTGEYKNSYETCASLLNTLNFFDISVSSSKHRRPSPSKRSELQETVWNRKYMQFNGPRRTLSGYAPAGRLDINSTGLIIFTRSGVIAKKLLASNGSDQAVEKEYLVRVAPLDPNGSMPNDLSFLLRRGNKLKEDKRPLQPLVEASWLNEAQIRFVMKEGRKRQIRRMCKELLGLNVLALKRVRIGQIRLSGLPEGHWRPLIQKEIESLIER